MEPANQPPVKLPPDTLMGWSREFLPDADALEKSDAVGKVSITLYILTALVLLTLLWASVFEVDQVVTARGRLVTAQPNIVVQPFETAQVTALHVQPGQVVKKGQTLALLDPTFISADLTQAQDRLRSLNAEVRRVEQELAGKTLVANGDNREEQLQAALQTERQASYQARLLRLDESVARLQASVQTNHQEVNSLDSRVKSLTEIEAMNEELTQKQFQSRMRLLETRERRQEVEREWLTAKNRSHELQKQLAETLAERAAFVKEWRQRSTEELVSVRRERDSVAEQVKKAERRSRLIELTSPSDAVVLEVAQRSTGSIVREAEPLVTLVPLGEPLQAEVQITSQDVGYVKVQDPVRLKIDAFPFQKHGLINGQLDKLGQDAFTPSGNNAPAAPYYLGSATLDHNNLRNLPRNAPLLPGMTLSAEIVVGKRTVMSYVMYPVMRGLAEAAREP
jgi:hemolysin D